MPLDAQGFLDVNGVRLEYRFAGAQPERAPVIVLLHEGLGCAAIWGAFPQALAEAAGCGVLAYSRAGYGGSDPVALPRPLSYMHEEALQVLPALLDRTDVHACILAGHSDGGSIAAIHAGCFDDPRVRGVSLMAPHFFVEDISLASIRQARVDWETTDLRARLARWHKHVDCAFLGWNDAWLDPAFRAWNLTPELRGIRCPVQIIQGEDDQYGTVAQIEMAQRECCDGVESLLMPGVRHAPFREAQAESIEAITGFFRRVMDDAGAGRQAS